jgi:zeaxanthin epoxidase
VAGRRTRQQQQQQQQQQQLLQAEGWRQQQQQQQGRGRTTPLEMAAVGPGGRPLKVAIAGGGVGGLATAYYMLKKGMDVTVYEKTAQFSRFGGPIQFASNALSTIKAMDDGLFDRVIANFTFTGTRACGIKDGLRATNNYALENSFLGTISYLWDKTQPADWYVRFPLKECADLYGLPYTGVIDRPDLQETFLEECKKFKPDFIRNGAAVESYTESPGGGNVKVTLADGSTPDEEYDVLVGSDGIWSSVRAQMYGETVKETSKDKKRRQGCTYSGYTVFAG